MPFPRTFSVHCTSGFCTKSSKHANPFYRKLQIKANILISFYIGRSNTNVFVQVHKIAAMPHFGQLVESSRNCLMTEETTVTKTREP